MLAKGKRLAKRMRMVRMKSEGICNVIPEMSARVPALPQTLPRMPVLQCPSASLLTLLIIQKQKDYKHMRFAKTVNSIVISTIEF